MALNGTNLGLFRSVLVWLGETENTEMWSRKVTDLSLLNRLSSSSRSPRFVSFGANMTLFGANITTTAIRGVVYAICSGTAHGTHTFVRAAAHTGERGVIKGR